MNLLTQKIDEMLDLTESILEYRNDEIEFPHFVTAEDAIRLAELVTELWGRV